jgi:hypothetical protein
MQLTHFPVVTTSFLCLIALGCNQQPPPGSDADEGETGATTVAAEESGTDGGSAPEEGGESDTGEGETGAAETDGTDTGDGDGEPGFNPFFYTIYPLADGATWTYVDKNPNGQVLGMEVVEAQEIEWDDEVAWMLTDSPNSKGEWTDAVIVRDDEVTMRVHKTISDGNGPTEIVDYDPGFVRANDEWMDAEVGYTEEFLYERTEADGQGDNEDTEDRGHIYTIVAVDEEVEVPAGVFNCIKVERVRSVGGKIGEQVYFWYAPGIGKVREERPADSEIEELASVSLPGGVDLP